MMMGKKVRIKGTNTYPSQRHYHNELAKVFIVTLYRLPADVLHFTRHKSRVRLLLFLDQRYYFLLPYILFQLWSDWRDVLLRDSIVGLFSSVLLYIFTTGCQIISFSPFRYRRVLDLHGDVYDFMHSRPIFLLTFRRKQLCSIFPVRSHIVNIQSVSFARNAKGIGN